MPHITVQGERGLRRKIGEPEKTGDEGAGRNPMNPIYRTADRKERTRERETYTAGETDYRVAVATFTTSGKVIHWEGQQKNPSDQITKIHVF